MHSYQIIEPGKPLEPRDVDTPEPQGSEVLLSVETCGVCHSDLHLSDGYFDMGDGRKAEVAGRSFPLPFTLGHEVVGTVEAAGPDAGEAEVGRRYAIYPWIGCGECRACKAGDEHVCEGKPAAIGVNVPGGYSDHVLVPHPRYLVDIGSVPPGLAGTYACSGVTAYSALKKTAPLVGKDEWLLIVGAGGVGLNGVHIARSVIEGKVVVADIDPAKREAALAAGADEAIDNADPEARKTLRTLTGGGAAAAIDFVGAPASAQFGLGGVRKNGTLIVVGLYGGSMPLSLALLPLSNLTIRGSYVGSLAEFRELMELARAGKVPALEVAERPMAEVNDALQALRDGEILGRLVLKP